MTVTKRKKKVTGLQTRGQVLQGNDLDISNFQGERGVVVVEQQTPN